MSRTPSRSALLARELLTRVARRELRPGDPIDLQALGRRHGVSRTVVREALADLGGKGLVVARPKVGTTIAPESQWNLLDPLLVSVAIAEPGPDSMLAEATELRGVIEPALAAEAARDASRPQRAAVLDAVRTLAGAVGAGDRGAVAEADEALHTAIAEACGNRLLRSIDHALVPVRALHRQRLLSAQMSGDAPGPDVLRALTMQTALGLAIARREPERAAEQARALATAARSYAQDAAAHPGLRPLASERRPSVASRPAAAAPSTTVSAPGDGPAPGDVPAPDRPSAPSTAPAPASGKDAAPDPGANAWPDTEMLLSPVEALLPLPRGHLDVREPPAPIAVPALVTGSRADAPAPARPS